MDEGRAGVGALASLGFPAMTVRRDHRSPAGVHAVLVTDADAPVPARDALARAGVGVVAA